MNQQLQERVRSVQHYEAFVNDILKTKLRYSEHLIFNIPTGLWI